MFRKSGVDLATQLNPGGHADCICEDCYRSFHYGEDSYVKAYKHCVLDAIQPEASRNICRCPNINHFDKTGRARRLFPMSKGAKHTDIDGKGGLQCGLLKLGELAAEAKYDGMHHARKQQKRPHSLSDMKRESIKKQLNIKSKKRPWDINTTNQPDAYDTQRHSRTGNMADGMEAQDGIPFPLRGHTEEYPFRNVHMALRIGPLIIENGVAQ
jgi:hypothetical protein